jgi:hypothetical protein
MSAHPSLTDFNDAGGDLETALTEIKGIADILYSMEDQPDDSTALSYLSARLHEHREEAMDAFRRIFGMDQYREGDGEGGKS